MTALLRAPSGWRAQTDVPHALRDRVVDHVLAPVTLVLVVVTVASGALSLAGVTIPPAVQIVPFAVSVLLFGLPHGALDHLVPARLRPGTSTTRSVLVVVALYVVVGAGTAALWTATPLLGFLVFIGITWFHWGQGDLWVDRLLGDGAAGPLDATVTVLVRGALPMVVPFVAQPTAALSVVTGTATALGDHASAPTAGVSLPGAVRVAAGSSSWRSWSSTWCASAAPDSRSGVRRPRTSCCWRSSPWCRRCSRSASTSRSGTPSGTCSASS